MKAPSSKVARRVAKASARAGETRLGAPALPRRSRARQRVAAQVGVGGHRLAARGLDDLEPERTVAAAEQQGAFALGEHAGVESSVRRSTWACRTPSRSPSGSSR